MIEERNIIKMIIKKSINNHLVNHVKTNPNDKRDRIDILIDEASLEIMKHFDISFKKFVSKN